MPTIRSFSIRRSPFWILIAAAGLLSGCSDQPTTTLVSGRVTLDGEALDEVQLQFYPNPEKPTDLPAKISSGITNEAGEFTLKTVGAGGAEGVLPGSYMVTLKDLKPENDREYTGLPRLPGLWLDPYRTPFEYEITEEPQEIVLELDSSEMPED